MSEYQLLKDITYPYQSTHDLSYSSACRGLWNIVHLATQVPNSHQIFVCPTSCLRGVVLTTAEMGCMDRLSTITVGEDNILEGDLEERILFGTRKIIASLKHKPSVIFIFTSCIHHFMQANYQRVYQILRKEYPDIDFIDAYMNPIMRKKSPPIPTLQRQVYRMLNKTKLRSNIVNFFDDWFEPEYNDVYDHLKKQNIHINDFSRIKTYEEYKTMNQAIYNIGFHAFGKTAGKDMQYRLDIPYYFIQQTYEYDQIDQTLNEISHLLQSDSVSMEDKIRYRLQTDENLNQVQQRVKDISISIDQSAIEAPLSLATLLLEHGFNVEEIYLESMNESLETFNKLKAIKDDIKIYDVNNWNMRVKDRYTKQKVLAIGQNAAYFNETSYFVNVIFTAGMYGYKGIQHLCDLLLDAYDHPKDTREVVSMKGWCCTCR